MNVRLVTPWDLPCGISEHSKYLVAAIQAADPSMRITVEETLHPDAVFASMDALDVLFLNYHAALTSQWHPAHIKAMRTAGCPVVVIYHDSGVPNSDQCHRLHEATLHYPQLPAGGAFVVQEPVEDLPGAVYIRQGIPDWAPPNVDARSLLCAEGRTAYYTQPILGTVGFPFPWKNYDLLVDATAAAGWALLLLAPTATPEQTAAWTARHPAMLVVADFIPAETVVAYLGGCDATAFLYVTHNAGTSGAIRQGIAARKPVLATWHCRQFRDLQDSREPEFGGIRWLEDLSIDGVVRALCQVRIQRVDPGIVALAERDSWRRIGGEYARLLRATVRGGGGVGVGIHGEGA